MLTTPGLATLATICGVTRAEPNPSVPGDADPPIRQARRRRRWPWLLVPAVLLLVALGLGGWLASKALVVRDELMAARAELRGLAEADDPRPVVRGLAGRAQVAVTAAHDPVWGLAEALPWAGDNLRAVRLAAEALDALTAEVAVPVLDALEADSTDPMLKRVLPLLSHASRQVSDLSQALRPVLASSDLVPEVRSGVEELAGVLDAADPFLAIVPGLFGAEGERNYLLVAQSNAEVLALGGSAASQTQLRFRDGEMDVVRQADSSDYQWGVPADVDIDQSAIDLYNEYLINNVNTSVGRPDWPTAARTISALWHRDIDPAPLDGLISMDPLALARVMRATGPVTVDGRELNSENIVRFVLSEVYALSEPGKVAEESDETFKQVALAVFDRLTHGLFDPVVLLSAVRQSIDTGSLMFYSTDPVVQQQIAPLRIAGILPTSNDEATTIGVYYRDASLGSKKDYYLHAESDITSRCTADGGVEYTVGVTLWLDLTRKQAEKLPRYVVGDLDTKVFRTQVFIYGPPGTTVTGEVREKGKSWNWRPLHLTDLGRPTPSFMTVNQLGGEKLRVAATFTGPPGSYGPLEVRTTPIVNPTKVTLDDGCRPR